jgi:RNA polymerase sigma-70 factor (ECF subfamily)
MTQEEIAEALDVRLGTVKSRLHRGLAELREALA